MNKPIDSQAPLNTLSDTPSPERRTLLRQAGIALATPWLMPLAHAQGAPAATKKPKPTGMILCYRRFADTAEDAQTVRRTTLAAHFKAIKEAKASVISMVDLVAHHAGRLANLPPRPVVLSVDDCDRSIVDILMRQMQGSAWPVSLYITPTTVGQGKRALTWDDLSGLHHSGRFSVQARTFSGLDLVQARKDRSPEAFEKFAREEMEKGKVTVEQRLVKPISFQAWPNGSFDKDLMDIAAELGFHASVTLGDKPASLADPLQALSRFVMHDGIQGPQLKKLILDTYGA